MTEFVTAPLFNGSVQRIEPDGRAPLGFGERVVCTHAQIDHEIGKHEPREDVLSHRSLALGFIHPAFSGPPVVESIK